MGGSLEETPRSRHLTLDSRLEDNAAINTLPPEILAQIFLANIDPDDDTDRDGHIFLSRMKAVCWLWRDIALSTPALWTTINLEGNLGWPRGVRASLRARLQEALMRSRDASLDVVIQLGLSSKKRYSAMKTVVTEDILPQIHRTRSLHLLFHEIGVTRHVIPIKGQLPRLEVLKINWVVENYPPLWPRRIFEEGSAPELRSLSINGWLNLPLLASVPLALLRRLSLHPAGVHEPLDMTDILKRCVNIEELDLNGGSLYLPSDSNTHPFALPRLKSLCASYSWIAGFSRLISTPNLEALSLCWGSRWSVHDTILRPLSQKLHTVVERDWGYRVDPRQYVEIYEAHPGIKTISATRADYEAILASLHGKGLPSPPDDSPSEPTLPVLEFLEFTLSPSDRKLSFQPLPSVLERRKNLRVIINMHGRFKLDSKDGLLVEWIKERYGERFMLLGKVEFDDPDTISP